MRLSVRASVRALTLSNMNISATSWPIEMKFYLKHHWGGGKASVGFDPDRIRTLVSMATDRRDVPVGVPLDLSTPTGMSCIGTYGENCKSDNVSKYRVLFFAFLLL